MEIISPADRVKMELQLKELFAQRPVITARIAEARANGDLKENADYHAAREEQGLVEAKIRELMKKREQAYMKAGIAVYTDGRSLQQLCVIVERVYEREARASLKSRPKPD